MADVTIKAAYATLAEDDGFRFVGFVEEDDEGYALFRQPVDGGPVWFELNDEEFGDEDALLSVTATAKGLQVLLTPGAAPRFGWASSVSVKVSAKCDGRDQAFTALKTMLGDLWQEGADGVS